MASSANTKAKLIKRLENKYGTNWKTPLSKDLGVHLTSVRRMFNSGREISPVWLRAINQILNESTPVNQAKP